MLIKDRNDSGSDSGFLARATDTWNSFTDWARERGKSHYQSLVVGLYGYFIPPGMTILGVGTHSANIIKGLNPARYRVVEPNSASFEIVVDEYRDLNLRQTEKVTEGTDSESLKFDFIILSDTVNYLNDILGTLIYLKTFCDHRTRIIMNFYSRLWQPFLTALELIGLRSPKPQHSWVTREDVENFLILAGIEPVVSGSHILLPVRIPIITKFINNVLAPFPPFRWFCLSNMIVGRLPVALSDDLGVSVICPCRNESGNIKEIVTRLPEFNSKFELIFVEGHSSDGTIEECVKVREEFPEKQISVYQQTGKGKGDAVRIGFAKAKYDILVILDADMTVRPEELPGFVEVLRKGTCEFVNGSRLVYPMEDEAMRFLNLLGNKFFSFAFSFLLGQTIKDTLCGTKVLLKDNYDRLVEQRSYLGDFDPFGDFDLIFGASRLALKIRDYPIRYDSRKFGTTQIRRFSDGLLLFKMCGIALIKLKMR